MAKKRTRKVTVTRTDPKRAILDRMRAQEMGRNPVAAPVPSGPPLTPEKKPRPLQAVVPEDALGVLKRRQRTWVNAERARDEAVVVARRGGASWDAIGRATGLTADGARSRWGRGR